MADKKHFQAQISIKNLERHGSNRWNWTQIFVDWDGETVTQECRTNGNGGGLFFWNEHRANWEQNRGTCQYSLSRKRKSAYQQIRRYIKANVLQI